MQGVPVMPCSILGYRGLPLAVASEPNGEVCVEVETATLVRAMMHHTAAMTTTATTATATTTTNTTTTTATTTTTTGASTAITGLRPLLLLL